MAQPPRRCEANGTVASSDAAANAAADQNGAPIGAPGGTDCGLDPYVPMADKSKFCDVQTLKLQENPEDVPAGEMPRHMILHVERTMVQRITPGTRVKVMGVYTLSRGMGKAGSKRGRADESSTISTPYIRVVGMTEESEGARGDAHFTDAEHTEFKAFAARPFKEVIGDIRSRIAPAIFGADDIKAAVASLLFSGSRKTTQDGAKLRGDVNVLLMGDPSTAKSQFLKFVEKTAPICVYTSGKGSSAAGLTASVVRDSDGGFMLEGRDGARRRRMRVHRRVRQDARRGPRRDPRGDGAADDLHRQGWHHHGAQQQSRGAGGGEPPFGASPVVSGVLVFFFFFGFLVLRRGFAKRPIFPAGSADDETISIAVSSEVRP